jgi:hypothetical protein
MKVKYTKSSNGNIFVNSEPLYRAYPVLWRKCFTSLWAVIFSMTDNILTSRAKLWKKGVTLMVFTTGTE